MDPTLVCVAGVGGFWHYSDDTEKTKSGIKEERTATFFQDSASYCNSGTGAKHQKAVTTRQH